MAAFCAVAVTSVKLGVFDVVRLQHTIVSDLEKYSSLSPEEPLLVLFKMIQGKRSSLKEQRVSDLA